MYACIYELWKNCRGRTDGTGRVGKSKVLQEVLADLKILFRKKEHPETALKKVLETLHKKNNMQPFSIEQMYFFFVILKKSILTSVTPISSFFSFAYPKDIKSHY